MGLRGAGCIVFCVGSLSRAHLRMPGAAGDAEVFGTFVEPTEIVSLAGMLCADGAHLQSPWRGPTAPVSAATSRGAAS